MSLVVQDQRTYPGFTAGHLLQLAHIDQDLVSFESASENPEWIKLISPPTPSYFLLSYKTRSLTIGLGEGLSVDTNTTVSCEAKSRIVHDFTYRKGSFKESCRVFFERHAIPVEHEGRFRDVCFRNFMIEKPLFNLESGNCEKDFYCREHWKVISKIIHDHHFDSHVTTPVSLDVHHDVDAICAHFSIPKHSTVVVEQEQKVLTRKFCSARSSLWSSASS